LKRIPKSTNRMVNILKISIVLPTIFFISLAVTGQDLIVTSSGDSLNCKIHKERSGFVQFTYLNPSTNKPTKTVLSSTKISSMQRNFYAKDELNPAMKKMVDYQKVRLNANIGYSYKLGISSARTPEEEAYERDIRNGYRFGGGIDLFFNDRNGIGFKFSQFNSRADIDVQVSFDNNPDSTETYAATENLRIAQYSLLWRRRWNSDYTNNSFNLGLGLGLVTYRDNITFLNQTLYEQAFAVALELELSYDIGLSDNIYLTFGADMGTGYFESSTVNFPDGSSESITYPDGEGVSAGRASVWIGITFKN